MKENEKKIRLKVQVNFEQEQLQKLSYKNVNYEQFNKTRIFYRARLFFGVFENKCIT